MDSEMTIFAQTAGVTLAALMTTDAFQNSKRAVLELWRRVRPMEAAEVDEQMEATRTALMRAQAEGNEDQERELTAWWQERLALLFAADPTTINGLRQALAEASDDEQSRDRTHGGSIQMTANAKGHGRVFQAGRDQHIIDR
ncbi:hypothetical protein [Streptomyces cyaneofuscatus]|uniref:hypothetical protein n=1 Tax=Streptomyces cyaneofuscatus TaxID=66883 RepID=UPI0036908763